MTNTPEPRWLTISHVRMLHAETLRLFGGSPGLRDAQLLESALAKVQHLFAYTDHPSLFDLAAAYGFGLARNHAFVDGNKRVALLAIRAFLYLNGYTFQPDQDETVTMIEGLASGTVTQEALTIWIRNHASPR